MTPITEHPPVGATLPGSGCAGRENVRPASVAASIPVVPRLPCAADAGSTLPLDLDQLVRPTIDALAGEDVLLVVATGGRPVADLGPLPRNVRAADYVPYDQLFPRLAAFVTNGGFLDSNTADGLRKSLAEEFSAMTR